jgi:hypothetical protein
VSPIQTARAGALLDADQCRARAQACGQHAAQSDNPEDAASWLSLANDWLKHADQRQKDQDRRSTEPPIS